MSGPSQAVPTQAVIAVPVANVWSAPDAPRELDRPTTLQWPDPSAWMAAMGREELLGLHGRLETQALMGEPVVVVSERSGWAEVELPRQPSRKGARGYPGWVRREHLTEPSWGTGPFATISWLIALGHTEADTVVALSFGTTLRLEAPPAPDVQARLRTPGGALLEVPGAALAPVRPSAEGILASAFDFLGKPYVWGGCSAYGVDCSGLAHLAHRTAGLTIPRDADDQAASGKAVPTSEAEPGDLIFFSTDGAEPHHVAFWSAPGQMLHSPGSGRGVEETGLAGSSYETELMNVARRYAGPPDEAQRRAG